MDFCKNDNSNAQKVTCFPDKKSNIFAPHMPSASFSYCTRISLYSSKRSTSYKVTFFSLFLRPTGAPFRFRFSFIWTFPDMKKCNLAESICFKHVYVSGTQHLPLTKFKFKQCSFHSC